MAEMFSGIPAPEPTLNLKQSLRILVIVIALAAGFTLTLFLVTPRTVHWSVSDGRLHIRSMIGNDEFPLLVLQLDQARILDLKQEPAWLPQEKHFGYNGFGYDAGRFKLRNGELADLYLATETIAVRIPKRDSVPLVVGVDDPNIFLAALKDAAVH